MVVTQDKYKPQFLSLVGTPEKMMPLKSNIMSQVDLRVDWSPADMRVDRFAADTRKIDPRVILYRTFETFENKIHQNSKGCLCSLCKFRTCWDCLKIAKHLCRLSPFFKNLKVHNKFAPWVETSPFRKKTKQPAYLWFADLKDLQCCLAD